MIMEQLMLLIYDDPIINYYIGHNIYPNYTTYLGNCIVYSFHTYYNDRKVKKQRLRLTIITDTLELGDRVEDRVAELLLTLGDNDDGADLIEVQQSGGGNLYDDARHKNHRILYYDCLLRSIGGI
jgi:hypothetical protein